MNTPQPLIEFSAERTVIHPGDHATLRWRVEGVKAVYFFRKGEPWQEHGVAGQGERRVSPSQTTQYRLRVLKADGSVEVHKINIQVQPRSSSQTLSVDKTKIKSGECVTFRWHVEGVKAVHFFAEGERWQDHGVVGEGEQRVCPSETTTYCLQVTKADNSVEVHKIKIHVQPETPLQTFSVDRTEIKSGECVTFRWHVEGVKAVYFFPKGERWQDHGVVGMGEQQVCPSETTAYRLRVVKTDHSVEVHKIKIHVQPEERPPAFSVDRMEIKRGECVTFQWRVEGVKAVHFFAEGERWQDHGVVGVGERRVCPSETTTHCLRVTKAEDSVEIHYITVEVRG